MIITEKESKNNNLFFEAIQPMDEKFNSTPDLHSDLSSTNEALN